MQETLASQAFVPAGSTAPAFAAYVRDEIAKYARIVKEANIKVD
jgi:tripartite-type tricarboxylate transporter receptor subunit TctC